MTTSYDISRMYIHALGGQETPGLVRAIAIWLRFESGNTVVGNNPWNLHAGQACTVQQKVCMGGDYATLPGQIGNRYAGSGDKNVAIFDTLEHGVQANARNLNRVQGAGYEAAVDAIRRGDGPGFLIAIQNSKWSAGHYSFSKLTNAFKSTANFNFNINLVSKGGSDTSGNTDLGAWADQVHFPVGHIITADDVNTIMDTLYKNGWFNGDTPLGGSYTAAKDILMQYAVGKPWGKPLQDELQGRFFNAAENASNPLEVFGNIGNVLFNYVFTLETVAIIAGGIILFIGFRYLMSATGGQQNAVPTVNLAPNATVHIARDTNE